MGVWNSYKMRLRRKRLRLRALVKQRDLRPVVDRTGDIRGTDLLLVSVLRNEAVRLPYFLQYYRDLGINHFLFVDNGSTDGGADLLADQPDVSLWSAHTGYKSARYGVDWANYLLSRYGHGHWCLTVDPDELLQYPFCDTRPLRALTDWLEASSLRSFGTMLLDLYPKGPIHEAPYLPGQNPLDIAKWFDSGNYRIERNPDYRNLWIQGGPRERVFFGENPKRAPALNKIPLVRWDRRYVYVSSTHNLLPRGLNLTYDDKGGEKASGILLHTKFLNTFAQKTWEELDRRQHYAGSKEYQAYAEGLKDTPTLWCDWSEKFINWRQLEVLGLMSKGNWA